MFKARYEGRCPSCDNAIGIGMNVTMVDTDLGRVVIHESCAEDGEIHVETRTRVDHTTGTMPRGKTAADRCDRCFLVHSPGQETCE